MVKNAIIKRDTKENWLKSNYIPEKNVIIVVDYADGSSGVRFGDGINNVNYLPDLITPPKAQVDENNTLIL